MKSKLTITVDSELIPAAKRYARSKGVSLSAVIEQALREATGEERSHHSLRVLAGTHSSSSPERRLRSPRNGPPLRLPGAQVPQVMLLDTNVLLDAALDQAIHT